MGFEIRKTNNIRWYNWHNATISIDREIIGGASKGGANTLNKTEELGVSSGQLEVNYNMAGVPDRLVIKNDNTGGTLFDTKSLSQSNSAGEVSGKKGSGVIIDFNLGEGNTKIKVLVNPGGSSSEAVEGGSVFTYSLVVNPNEVKNYRIEDYQPNLKGKSGRRRHKKITK